MQEEEKEPLTPLETKTLWITGILIVLIMAVLASFPVQATEARNWCADWQDGYEASFYLMCRQCQTIEPKECPEPEPTDSSGYMRGVKDGAADGKQKQKEWI